MSATTLRVGFFADGVWKALVGLSGLALLPWLVDRFGAPAWLLGVTVLVVLASAAAECSGDLPTSARATVPGCGNGASPRVANRASLPPNARCALVLDG